MARVATVFCLLLAIVAAAGKKRKSNVAARIMGGRDTDISEVPYMVSLQLKNAHECGGAIIGEKHVVTAGHCVYEVGPSDISVRVGSNYHASGGETRKVKAVKIHHIYKDTALLNDIAILELDKALSFSSTIKPIALSTKEPKVGEDVLLSGWGVVQEKDKEHSRTLKSVVVQVVSREDCKRIHRGKNPITDNMFCAGVMAGGKDSCRGDSGGPAVIGGNLAGIISWGVGCGKRNSPGVYTAIHKYQKWIQEQTR